MVISSRTPEGRPNRCPVCGSNLKIEPSDSTGDAPCPHCGHLLWFTWEDLGNVQVIKPTGSLFSPESLATLPSTLLLRHGVRIVVDLSEVQYLSRAALTRLINLKLRVRAFGGLLVLRHVPAEMMEVFRITRLDHMFSIED